MKALVNPNFTVPRAVIAKADLDAALAAKSLAELVVARPESRNIAFEYVRQRLGLTLTDAELAALCAAAGLVVVDV